MTGLDPKTAAALYRVDSQDKRDALEAMHDSATATWERFSSSLANVFAPRLKLTRMAIAALDFLLREEISDLLASVGVAVQDARGAARACLEMGAETLVALRALDRRLRKLEGGNSKPINARAMEAALDTLRRMPDPEDLPEGSTVQHPLEPR